VRYADVALLLRTRGRLKDFEEALSENGVPFYVVGGAGFYERQEVVDLLSLLRCIDDSSDVVSLLAVLRSPLFGLYDDTILRLVQAHGGLWNGLNAGDIPGLTPDQLDACQSASRVINLGRELRSRLPALDLIDLLLKQTGYEHVICRLPGGVQMAANVRRLREIASGLAVRGITELGDFLAEVRLITDAAREGEAPVQTEESDAVKILTVHAAKGLEFPVVILGDASRSSGPPESASFRISWSVPYGLGLRFPWAGDKRETRSFADSDQEDEAASDAESIRLLYVALTRARDYLLITGVDRGGKPGAKAEECWFGRLQKALAGLERPEQVRLTRVSARLGRGSAASPGQMDEISIPNGPGEGDLPLPARALIRYSLSEVQSYAICPKRYYYQYRLRVPPIGQDPWGEGEKSEPASAEVETEVSADGTEALGRQVRGPIPADTLGTAVHWVIERLRDLDAVEAMTSEAAEVHGLTGETAASRLARLVRTYVSSEEFEVVRRQGEIGVSSEVPLVCRLQKDVLVTGVADRLVHLPNGRMRLVDFKTNSVTAAAVDEVAERYRLQLPIYALALQQAGYEVEEASYFFLAPGVKRACDVSKGRLARVETEVAAMCRTMEADTLFTAREGTACDHCGYRPLCR
jgi:ATP-dependent helicase/nuclease subunit A